MIAVVQRVSRASVRVAAQGVDRSIWRGVVILLGVVRGDGAESAEWLADKIAGLRLFPDDAGKMNRSLVDVGGEALVVSQFTLVGDCRKGTRPSFDKAEIPEKAEALYQAFARRLRDDHSLNVRTGEFGAMMEVELVNDGPVTLILEHPVVKR